MRQYTKKLRSNLMTPQTFFQKYELPLFFLLAYALSWMSVPFANGGLLPHGPTIAAVIVVALVAGRQGLRDVFYSDAPEKSPPLVAVKYGLRTHQFQRGNGYPASNERTDFNE
jgi:hypothetical protein